MLHQCHLNRAKKEDNYPSLWLYEEPLSQRISSPKQFPRSTDVEIKTLFFLLSLICWCQLKVWTLFPKILTATGICLNTRFIMWNISLFIVTWFTCSSTPFNSLHLHSFFVKPCTWFFTNDITKSFLICAWVILVLFWLLITYVWLYHINLVAVICLLELCVCIQLCLSLILTNQAF